MSNNEKIDSNDPKKTRGNAKLVGSLVFVVIVFLSAWTAVAYFHIAFLQGYITSIINPTRSVLSVTLIAAFGGFISSIPILRRLSPKGRGSPVKVEPIPQYRSPRVHPLFMTSRPARDTNFVIRKTKNRGRISRNRAGERLPHSYQE